MSDTQNTPKQPETSNANISNNHNVHSHSSGHHSHSSGHHSHSSRHHSRKGGLFHKLKKLKRKSSKPKISKINAKTIMGCIAVCLLLGVFAGLTYQKHLQDKISSQNYSVLAQKAKPYEDELNQIRKDLSAAKFKSSYTNDTSNVIIAFNMSSVDDLTKITSYAERYKIEPAIVLDCNRGLSTIDEFLNHLKNTSYDIILTAEDYDDYVRKVTSTVRDKIAKYGLVDTKMFYLRRDMNTESTLQNLFYDGYRSYTVYIPQEITSGIDENGLAYLTYSNIANYNYSMSGKIISFLNGKESALFVFDMAALADGSMNEDTITSSLECLVEYEEAQQIEFSDVSETVKELTKLKDASDKDITDYYKYEEEQKVKIKELQQKISDIYSGRDVE